MRTESADWLHRFLHRFCKLFVSCVKVVHRGNPFAVSKPLANDMGRKRVREFRLSGGPQIVEQFRPHFQTGSCTVVPGLIVAFKIGPIVAYWTLASIRSTTSPVR